MNSARNLLACAPLAFALAGCPVDHRTLTGAGGSAGRPTPSAGSSGQGGVSGGSGGGGESGQGLVGAPVAGAESDVAGAGGEAGEGAPSVQIVDGCVDLDVDQVGDCSESLLQNPGFKLDTADWKADVGAVLSWTDSNAFADLPSGSALVASAAGSSDMDGLLLASAGQCLPMTSGSKLEIMANVLIKSGQGEGLAGIGIFFFDKPDCMGSIEDSFDASGAAVDDWFTLSGAHTVADGVSSMRVRLTASRPYRSPGFEAKFDNVLVRSQ